MKVQRIYIYVSLAALFSRCAQVVPLGGGPRDTNAPVLLESIPLNGSDNFRAEEIVLRFDEYVQLRDLSNQLIVSPRLDPLPEIRAEGKRIVVRPEKGSLRPNTTYRIFFGTAIADMNESNPLKGFGYVFSTGTTIDSLRLRGSLSDAFTARPVGEAIVGLYYAAAGDTAIYHSKPDYVVRSDAGGNFEFTHLPADSFLLFSFTDQNRNGSYDPVTERVGFVQKTLMPGRDTVSAMRLFAEEPLKGFVKMVSSRQFGSGEAVLSRNTLVDIRSLTAGVTIYRDTTGSGRSDTARFFYKGAKDTLRLQVVLPAFGVTDSVRVTLPRIPRNGRLRMVETNVADGHLSPGGNITLRFNSWIDTLKTNVRAIRITSREDSLVHTRPLSGRWRGANRFVLEGALKTGATYSLKIDTAAFTDINGLRNDSSLHFFRYRDRRELGTLALRVTLPMKQPYVVQLLDGEGRAVREKAISPSLSSSIAVNLGFDDLVPGTYTVKVIADDNGSGEWDTGDPRKKRQPERVFIHSKSVQVTAEWETEERVEVPVSAAQ